MKFFTNQEISKKIIIAILLVMSFNFVSPTISQADFGGALFEPIAQFLCAIADLFIEALQGYFIGTSNIETGELPGIDGSEVYYIRYSPGIIFSGKVAGLKVNFINASDKDNEKITETTTKYDKVGDYEKLKSYSEFNAETAYTYATTSDHEWYKLFESGKAHIVVTWTKNDKRYVAVQTEIDRGLADYFYESTLNIVTLGIHFIGRYYDNSVATNGGKYAVYEVIETNKDLGEKESSALTLQPTVARWYVALRAIALVGLLSVLVYIGIRILISSTGQEKAKYKKMIGDWIVAICILFILQYIMLFITEIAQRVTDVLGASVIGEKGEDILMSNLRTSVLNNSTTEFEVVFPQFIMYAVLVIYTVIFTIQYLKRLLYMAFFTMIAPLIALTYPLDKIKDGQAQAFTMWIREYIFNALLQPMHLLLYYIFVSSAVNLVNSNPLYAVVAIGFLVPAEKFFRKMFGFDKATSAGQLGAAAGGALVMNAINKMGHRSGKQAAGKSSGGDSGSSGGGSTPRYISAPGGNPGGGNPGGGNPGGGNPGGGNPGGGNPGGATTFGQVVDPAKYASARSRLNGAKTLAGHYVNKKNLKKAGKGVLRMGAGALGAATLGTVGLAAGVATGDPSKALQYGAAGTMAGYMGANNLADKAGSAIEFGKKNKDLYQEGKWGTNELNARKSVNELGEDHDFKKTCRELGIKRGDREALIRQFHSNGITNIEDIKKAMNVRLKEGASQDEIIAAQKIRKEAERYGMKQKDIKQSLIDKGLNQDQIDRAMNLIDQL